MSKQLQFSLFQSVLKVYGVPIKTSKGSDSQMGIAWVLLPAAHTSFGTQAAELTNQLLKGRILQLSIYGNLMLVMSCVKMLLLNCSDSATDSQVAQTSGLLGQEDVQLAALLMSAIPRYAVSHKVKFRFSTLVMPVTGSTAAGWSEIKRQRSDKITCALFACSPCEHPVSASG